MTRTKDWPHAPIHRLGSDGVYMVTGGTLNKTHFFNTDNRLSLLENEILSLSKHYDWQLEAWAAFVNHYHLIARGSTNAAVLDLFLTHLHCNTARLVNELDQTPGRDVWYNFWDTRLTYQRSYLARLNYVHQNPVRHGLVKIANQYPWCSAAWFERTASPAAIKTIYSFKTDKVHIADDY